MRYRFESNGRVYEITIERRGDSYIASVDGQPLEFELLDIQTGQLSLRFSPRLEDGQPGRPVTIFWAAEGSQKWVSLDGCTYRLDKPSARTARPTGETAGVENVRAPMPAQVRAIQVAEGERVEKGATLLLLEAMKMEIRIKSPSNGSITRLLVTSGQAVEKDQVLVEIGE